MVTESESDSDTDTTKYLPSESSEWISCTESEEIQSRNTSRMPFITGVTTPGPLHIAFVFNY